MRICSFFNP